MCWGLGTFLSIPCPTPTRKCSSISSYIEAHELVVDDAGESIRCSIFLAIQCSEVEGVNGMSIVSGMILVN